MSEEITVDLKDLLYRLLLNWRKIIVFCVIFAVLGNFAGVFKNYRKIKSIEESKDNELKLEKMEEEIEALEAGLNSVEIKEAKMAATTYQDLHAQYDVLRTYNDNSILMNINSESVPTVIVNYRIDNHYTVEYPQINKKDYTGDIMQEYITSVSEEAFIGLLAEKMGGDIDYAYVRELVEAYGVNGSIFAIRVVTDDPELRDAIAEVIKNYVADETPEIKKVFGDFDIVQVSEAKCNQVRADIRNNQQSLGNSMNTLRVNWMALVNNMTESQKKYYFALVGRDNTEIELTMPLEVEEIENEDETEMSYLSLKFLVLGFVLGGILYCGIIFVLYLIVPVLRVKENLSDGYGISVFGSVWLENSKASSAIDAFLKKIFCGREAFISYDERIKQLATGIIIQAKKEGYNNIYFTGASDKNEDVKKDIIKALGKDITAVAGVCPVYDPASLVSMSNQDAVVLVEMVGDSAYDEISKEVELANKAKVPVLGAVVVNK